MSDNLLDMEAIAELGGVKVGTVEQWRRRHSDFPAPTGKLGGDVPYWKDEDAEAVIAWLAKDRPPGRPRAEVAD